MELNIKYSMMKVFLTNWVNVLGIFIVALGYAIVSNYYDENVSRTVLQAVIASLILVCLYGLMFWGILIASLAILDWLLIRKNDKSLKVKLVIEWFIVSSPFIYWTIRYHEWIFSATVLIFLITQLLRERLIVTRSS